MEKENIKHEEGIVFPEESDSIIDGLLEKYGLIKNREKTTEEIVEAFRDPAKDPEEKIRILEDFPSAKVAQIVADYGYKKISLEEIPDRIKKELNINEEKAIKITDEIKTTILDLIKVSEPSEQIREEEAPITEDLEIESKIAEPTKPTKKEGDKTEKDTYREPIE